MLTCSSSTKWCSFFGPCLVITVGMVLSFCGLVAYSTTKDTGRLELSKFVLLVCMMISIITFFDSSNGVNRKR